MIERLKVKRRDLDSDTPDLEVESVDGEVNDIDGLAKFLAFMYFKLKEDKKEWMQFYMPGLVVIIKETNQ